MSSALQELTFTFTASDESDAQEIPANMTPVALKTISTFAGTSLEALWSFDSGSTFEEVYDEIGNQVCKISDASIGYGRAYALSIPDWVVTEDLKLKSSTAETTTVTMVLQAITN